MNLTWKNYSIKVWVEEIAGQWCLAFLSDDSSEVFEVGRSPEFEESSEYGRKKMKGCMLDSEPFCMGNQTVATSLKSAAHKQGFDFPSVSCVAAGAGQEEREGVGPDVNDFNSPQIGLNFDPTKPSYITTRSKRGRLNRMEAQNAENPDLNDVVEIGDNLDPFNLKEIFRMEEEERRAATGAVSRQEQAEMEDGCEGEEVSRPIFEKEVTETLHFGSRLGIKVEGFENHVKKLVSGEVEANRDQ
ncbi:hypothetical protein HanRHA438_Chr14g0670281 [Helianthus annuus]|nr:hypothetical protein HanRHA438_Chr14g0670281 [Helianthus annuus]